MEGLIIFLFTNTYKSYKTFEQRQKLKITNDQFRLSLPRD